MSEERWNYTIRHLLPSRLEGYEVIIGEIVDRLEDVGWSKRDRYAVRLALEESITNAIRHGNDLDHSKQVMIECKLSAERVWIEVCDEGDGFDIGSVPDCREGENVMKGGGRGLMLMNRFMDRVEHNETGNRVTLEKAASTSKDSAQSGPVGKETE